MRPIWHVMSVLPASRATRAATPLIGTTPLVLAYLTTALIFCISVVGVADSTIYARETANWRAQAVGQDWVDLVLAVPWLAMTAAMARRGSRSGVVLLVGGLVYAVYELVIYAFALHFNALFLVYCAALGLSVCSVVPMVHALVHHDVQGWFSQSTPVRAAGIFLIALGACFALLWLAEIAPALLRGTVPASIAEAHIPTNPVHVLDLSLVLPAHVVSGVLLLRKRPLGYVAAPLLLAFDVLMAASIGGMMAVMLLRGVMASLSVAAGMAVLSFMAGVLLIELLRGLR